MQHKIMVVDDDPDILALLELRLLEAGCEVLTAESGEQALEMLQAGTAGIELLLSDVQMEGMDGLKFLTRVGQLHAGLPVALMTAYGDLEISLEAIRRGAVDLILKPLAETEFERILQHVRREGGVQFTAAERVQPLMHECLQLQLPSRRAQAHKGVNRVYQHFLPALASLGINASQIRVCLIEAIENAVVHGNLGVNSALKESDWAAFEAAIAKAEDDPVLSGRAVSLAVRLDGCGLHITVCDQGGGFDVHKLTEATDPEQLMFSGRGLLLIRGMMSHVEWADGGRRIDMHRDLPDSG